MFYAHSSFLKIFCSTTVLDVYIIHNTFNSVSPQEKWQGARITKKFMIEINSETFHFCILCICVFLLNSLQRVFIEGKWFFIISLASYDMMGTEIN